MNYNTVKQETKQTIEFLNDVLLTELSTKLAFVTTAILGMDINHHLEVKIEVEGMDENEITVEIEQPFEPEKMFETMKIYPITPILSLDILLNDSPYKYTISRYSYSALIDCKMNFIAKRLELIILSVSRDGKAFVSNVN